MGVSLLDYLNVKAKMKDLDKKKLSDIMENGSDKEKEEAWKTINQNGGYEALADGDDY